MKCGECGREIPPEGDWFRARHCCRQEVPYDARDIGAKPVFLSATIGSSGT
jgi:hypothetical protein